MKIIYVLTLFFAINSLPLSIGSVLDYPIYDVVNVCQFADQPTITTSTPNICLGDTTTIQVSPADELNDETTWSLFVDSCYSTPIASDVNGVFMVHPNRTTTYYIRGTGCSSSSPCDSIVIRVSNPTFAADVIDESSDGAGDGQITVVNESAGIAPFIYSINNGGSYQASAIFSGLSPGNYPMRIKDSIGCTSKSADDRIVYWSEQPNNVVRSIRTDSFPPTRDTVSLAMPGALEIDEYNGKIYWAQETTSNDVFSSNLDGSNTQLLYTLDNYVVSLAIDPQNNTLFIGTRTDEIWTGSLDGVGPLTMIVPDRDGDIEDMAFSPLLEILFFVVEVGDEIWRVDPDGSNLVLIQDEAFASGRVRSITLDESTRTLYVGANNGSLMKQDMYGDTSILLLTGNGFGLLELEFDPEDSTLYAINNAEQLLRMHTDSNAFETFSTISLNSFGLALGSSGYYRVCGEQPDIPVLSVSPDVLVCPGTPITISIDDNAQLNQATEWVLYQDGCGQNRIASNTAGIFNITSMGITDYYVRGEGGCIAPGSCGMVSVGDTVIPVITCLDDTVYVGSEEEISISEIISGASLENNFGLGGILSNFNTYYPNIVSAIPNQYVFEMDNGVDGATYISDGGDDMYDFGNYLSTNIREDLEYTGGSLVSDTAFGPSGQYFTRFRDGIFLMAADMDQVEYFYIAGELGADGDGSVSGLSLQFTCGGTTYYAYVKRVDDGEFGDDDPTVNHMMIVPDYPLGQHTYYNDTDDDYDLLDNLLPATRLYYLLYSSLGGSHVISDAETETIFQHFVQNVLCQVTVADNCGTALITAELPALDCANLGVSNQVDLFAKDASGNVAACISNITILDTLAPTITCRADTVTQNEPEQCGKAVNYDVFIPIVNSRWADSVIDFSTQYSSTDWSAAQCLGPPNVYPSYGDFEEAWASLTSNGQREFLELYYSNAAPVNEINIYETYNPGAVDTVYLRDASTGIWHIVWSGMAQAPDPPDESRIFSISIPQTSYAVDAIRIAVNSPAVSSWNEIDAVQLSGADTLVQNYVVTDNCDGYTVNQISGLASGSVFPIGTTTNTFVATDITGMTDTCSFDVVVVNADSTCCSVALDLPRRPLEEGLYLTSTTIESTGLVSDQTDVVFKAGHSILLKPSFTVELGAEFLGIIDDCLVDDATIPDKR